MGILDASQFLFETALFVKQFVVVKAKQVQNGGVPVGYAYPVLHGGKAQLVGGAVGGAALNSGPGHPGTKGVLVMVATGLALILVGGQLGQGQPAELTAPD